MSIWATLDLDIFLEVPILIICSIIGFLDQLQSDPEIDKKLAAKMRIVDNRHR